MLKDFTIHSSKLIVQMWNCGKLFFNWNKDTIKLLGIFYSHSHSK